MSDCFLFLRNSTSRINSGYYKVRHWGLFIHGCVSSALELKYEKRYINTSQKKQHYIITQYLWRSILTVI